MTPKNSHIQSLSIFNNVFPEKFLIYVISTAILNSLNIHYKYQVNLDSYLYEQDEYDIV